MGPSFLQELDGLLPPFREVCWPGVSEFYGAGSVAAEYCGMEQFGPVRGTWAHGWLPAHMTISPEYLISDSYVPDRGKYVWVGRKEQETYLQTHGYRNSRAIGLPVAYLRETPVRRRKGTLLVMPAHSIEHTRHTWKFREYAEDIQRIRKEFAHVVVCIHPACLKKGYWVREFSDLGFDIMEGVRGNDRNALRRLQLLMRTFEFVTTNSLGSLIAYAAYFGARVSLWGAYAEYREEDFADHPVAYLRKPDALAQIVRGYSEECVRRHFPDFFCHPHQAPVRLEWGRQQVGLENRVSPAELRRLFGWGEGSRALWAMRRMTPRPLKRLCRSLLAKLRKP